MAHSPDRAGDVAARPAGSGAMRITVLAGGIGGSRFLRGVRSWARAQDATGRVAVTAIVNTADDIELFGLHVSPDLDTVMYTLGGGHDEERGWGRTDESFRARDELVAYGADGSWFGLGDRDLATHLVRTAMLRSGESLSAATSHLCERWQPGVRLLPMSDDPVETHVDIPGADGAAQRVHFQEYWVRLRAAPEALAVTYDGIDGARPAPGVLDAIGTADLILLAPSNPVVSIGPILAVPGIRDAVRDAEAPVVGVSPIIAGAPVRGMADRLLPAIGVDVDAGAVARHYGARAAGGILDGWLVDDADAGVVGALRDVPIDVRARPLLMTDVDAAAEIAAAAASLGEAVA